MHNILYVYNMTNRVQKQHIFSNMRIFQTCAQIRWSTTSVPADRQDARRGLRIYRDFLRDSGFEPGLGEINVLQLPGN